MRKVIWNLKPFTAKDKNGNVVDIGLETNDIKRTEGEKYIERLKNDGEKIISVTEEEDKLVILLND